MLCICFPQGTLEKYSSNAQSIFHSHFSDDVSKHKFIRAPPTILLQATSRLVLSEETYDQTLEALDKEPLVPDCLANAQLEVRIQHCHQVLAPLVKL